MITKICFTIYWKPVLGVLVFFWGLWVTHALVGAIGEHNRINRRLDNYWITIIRISDVVDAIQNRK